MRHENLKLKLSFIRLGNEFSAQAAWTQWKTVATLSFKLTLQITNSFQQAGLINDNNPEIYEKLLEAINSKKVRNCPD